MYSEDNEENNIIIDIGSDTCKVGLSKDSEPKVIPTCIGTVNSKNIFEFHLKDAQFVRNKAIQKKKIFSLIFSSCTRNYF